MRRMSLPSRVGVAVATCALAAAALAPAAGADDHHRHHGDLGIGHGVHHDHDRDHRYPHHPRTLRPGTVGAPVATGLNAPFGVDVDERGTVYVAETGTGDDANPAPGQVSAFRNGVERVLATDAPFLDDVNLDGHDDFAYTVGEPTNTLTHVDDGHKEPSVDFGAFEAAHNPDQGNTYGPRFDLHGAVSPACWSSVDPELQQLATSYTGLVDSDVFRTVWLPDGTRAVSDAAGNDVLRVDRRGHISVLAVLPPNVVHVTAADLSGPLTDSGASFPQCVLDAVPAAGFDYAFEPVPTGLAPAWDGGLYVGLLPGGEIPNAGKVVRIDLRNGQVTPFVSGLSDVTDIAFGNGVLYTTELFNGDITQTPIWWSHGRYQAGTPSTFATVPLPNGLAVGRDGTVYASINSLTPAGQVVPIRP